MIPGRFHPASADRGPPARRIADAGSGQLSWALAHDAPCERGDGLPLDRWLHESVWPREARLEDEDVYWGMVLGAAELLCNGVTTTCEQYRHPAAVVDAILHAGIRAVYTPAIFDVPDAGPGNTGEALLAGACAVVDATAGNELLSMGFGPHAAYTVPPEGLRAIAAGRRGRARRRYRSTCPRPWPSARWCRNATA